MGLDEAHVELYANGAVGAICSKQPVLPALVPALGIDQVIVTIADAPEAQLRRILLSRLSTLEVTLETDLPWHGLVARSRCF